MNQYTKIILSTESISIRLELDQEQLNRSSFIKKLIIDNNFPRDSMSAYYGLEIYIPHTITDYSLIEFVKYLLYGDIVLDSNPAFDYLE